MGDVLKRIGTALWLASEMLPPRTRGPGRLRCAAIHFRLALTRRLRRALGIKTPTIASFLGLRLETASYDTLWATFHELFVRREYPIYDERDGKLIIDCGANIGLGTMYFKLVLPNARVIAFEPSPSTFATLQRNIERNRLTHVELRNQAVAGEPGELELFVDDANPDSTWVSSVRPVGSGRAVKVECVRLSEVISGPVELLKLDIEGAEHGVLKDLVTTGAIRRVRRIVLELHHRMTPEDNRMSTALRWLEEAGMWYQVRQGQRFTTDREEFQTFIVDAYWEKGRDPSV